MKILYNDRYRSKGIAVNQSDDRVILNLDMSRIEYYMLKPALKKVSKEEIILD